VPRMTEWPSGSKAPGGVCEESDKSDKSTVKWAVGCAR